MDDINLGLYPQPQLCLLGLTTNQMDCSGACVFTVDCFSLAVVTSLPTPHPCLLPAYPLNTLSQNWCAPSLKWPKIKQVTNPKLYYIKFNVSISTIVLNKASLT